MVSWDSELHHISSLVVIILGFLRLFRALSDSLDVFSVFSIRYPLAFYGGGCLLF